jgi:hypothetical protein
MSQPKETLAQKLMANQKANEECARIILSQPDIFAVRGLSAEWARMILESKKDATGERGK